MGQGGFKGFTTQVGIRGHAVSGAATEVIEYQKNNLFAGVWETGQGNIDRFDHMLTGYGFFFWTRPCRFMSETGVWDNFKALTERNFKALDGIQNFTLESDSITHGIAGNEFPTVTNLKKDITTITLKHQELEGSPIREFYQMWVTGIRDPETGLAHYHGLINSDKDWTYSLKNHSAEALYVYTDPSGANYKHGKGELGIEYACYFTAMVPTIIPQSHLNYAVGEHAPIEVDVELRCLYHQSKVINELAKEYMQKYYIKNQYGDFSPNWSADSKTGDVKVSFTEGYNKPQKS